MGESCTAWWAHRSVLVAVLSALATMAPAQVECSFNDTYWDATCPTQGFSAGCYRWHLLDEDAPYADIRVCPVWDLGYTGAGFTIGVVDLGVRITHEDLADQYNSAASTDHCDESQVLCLSHGTQLAGLMVAKANNQLGIVGIAHGASFAEIALYADNCETCDSGSVRAFTDDELACALRFNNALNDVKVMSLAGGFDHVTAFDGCSGLGDCAGSGDCVSEAIEDAALLGRAGLGTVLVVSAGNMGLADGRTDYSRFTSHRFTIAVGGYTHNDVHWCKANPGSSLFLVAPSGDTTDCGAPTNTPPWELWTTSGASGVPYAAVVGTSFSAPIVGGVVALLLEADADVHGLELMSVRDVMHALANSARQLDDQDAGWDVNNGNPPHNIHYNYGFGAVDAYAAVGFVTDVNWRRALPERVIASGMIDPDVGVQRNGGTRTQTFTVQSGVAGNHLRVEHVEVVISASIFDYYGDTPTTDMGDLQVTLYGHEVAQHRTESRFAEYRDGETARTYDDVVFTSVRHWDESAIGDWTIELKNRGNSTIFWHGYEVRIYGTPECRGDFDADGTADSSDLGAFLVAYLSGETGSDGKPLADYDDNPGLNYPGDQDAFLSDLAACEE